VVITRVHVFAATLFNNLTLCFSEASKFASYTITPDLATQNRALFRKKCGAMGARRNFCKGATSRSGGRKSPSGVQGRSPGGGLGPLGAKPPEADGILLKTTYTVTDIVFCTLTSFTA